MTRSLRIWSGSTGREQRFVGTAGIYLAVSLKIVLLKSSRGTRSFSLRSLNCRCELLGCRRGLSNRQTHLVDKEQEMSIVCVQMG